MILEGVFCIIEIGVGKVVFGGMGGFVFDIMGLMGVWVLLLGVWGGEGLRIWMGFEDGGFDKCLIT